MTRFDALKGLDLQHVSANVAALLADFGGNARNAADYADALAKRSTLPQGHRVAYATAARVIRETMIQQPRA